MSDIKAFVYTVTDSFGNQYSEIGTGHIIDGDDLTIEETEEDGRKSVRGCFKSYQAFSINPASMTHRHDELPKGRESKTLCAEMDRANEKMRGIHIVLPGDLYSIELHEWINARDFNDPIEKCRIDFPPHYMFNWKCERDEGSCCIGDLHEAEIEGDISSFMVANP